MRTISREIAARLDSRRSPSSLSPLIPGRPSSSSGTLDSSSRGRRWTTPAPDIAELGEVVPTSMLVFALPPWAFDDSAQKSERRRSILAGRHRRTGRGGEVPVEADRDQVGDDDADDDQRLRAGAAFADQQRGEDDAGQRQGKEGEGG